MKRRAVGMVYVFARPLDRRRGLLVAGNLRLRCALGRAGVRRAKREGDGATPAGRFALGCAFFRADRLARPGGLLAPRPLAPDDGWCDDPADRRYNMLVKRLPGRGEERMWREDHLYDAVIEIAYNVHPAVRGCGSAIFLHLARHGLEPTAGCVAVDAGAMRRLLGVLGPATRILIC